VIKWNDCNALFNALISNPEEDWQVSLRCHCGIAYVNDLKNPNFVKIFHPNNLGKSCGSSKNPSISQ
jgi:hypothetical protein